MYMTDSDQPEFRTSEPQFSESTDAGAELPMAARIINSKSLFGESRIIHIEHRGMIYRMSITNQNRLILQK